MYIWRMAKRKTSLDCVAKASMAKAGVDFREDFHALPSSQVNMLVAWAKETGYRKSKSAPGSRARMYFQKLARLNTCRR